MIIDPAIVLAIGVVAIGLIEFLKRILKWEGFLAWVLAGACSMGATMYYLSTTNQFTWLAVVVYSFIVFGEATGLYHITAKALRR